MEHFETIRGEVRPLTNKALVKKFLSTQKALSQLNSWFIDAGLGHLRPSLMRQLKDKPPQIKRYLALLDLSAALKQEAERRHGPGLVYVTQLVGAN